MTASTPQNAAPTTCTPLVAPSLTTLWLGAPLRTGVSAGASAQSYAARLQAVLGLLQTHWSPGSEATAQGAAPLVPAMLSDVQALQGFALQLTDDACLRVRMDVAGHDSKALDGIVGGLGPLLDVLALHVQGWPSSHGTPAFAYLHQLIALQAPDAGAGFVPDLSWSRASGSAPASTPQPAALLAAAASWHALDAGFARGDEAAVYQRAVLHLVSAGAPAATGLISGLENTAHAALAHVAGWLQQAVRGLTPPPAASAPQTHVAATKAQWQRVMIDEKARYSVCGYQARMERSIGLIYLGMDESDPRYAPWSGPANAAAASVPESEGFERALRVTRSVLRAAGGKLGIKPLSDQVLGQLCTEWFGIPDGVHMRIDGSFLPFEPPGCPGQFAPPSGYIFQPDPGLPTAVLGEIDGHLIVDGALAYIRAQRAAGQVPEGTIGAALFAQFPDPAQEVQLARTLIGLMMGFLPTAQINLINFFAVLKGDAMERLAQQYTSSTEPDLYQRADMVLRKPMMAAIQQNPVPPQIWRTAVAADQWPGSPPVNVQPGDRIIVDALKVTQADLAAGVLDVGTVFGGNRDVSPFPTHACPGIWAGMGVFLGVLAGTLLEATDVNAVAG